MPDVLTLARVVLALIFAVAAVSKLVDRTGFARTLVAFGLPGSLVPACAVLLPIAELLCAAGLLVSTTARAAALVAIALLALFLVAMIVNLRKGQAPDCKCFGQLKASPIGWASVLRNIVLAAVAGGVAAGDAAAGALSGEVSWFQSVPSSWRMAMVYLAVVGAVIGYQLLWPKPPSRRRSAGQTIAAPPKKGAAMVSFPEPEMRRVLTVSEAATEALSRIDGGTMTLETATAGERPALVLFMTAGCSACERLMPQVTRLLEADPGLRLVAVSTGTLEMAREKAAALGLSEMLVPRDAAIPEAFGIHSYPTALLMRDGRADGSTAEGGESILRLIRKITAPPLRIGEQLPSMRLQSVAGEVVDLSALMLGAARVLLFWSPGNVHCQEILDDVKRLEERRETPAAQPAPSLIVVALGSATFNREQGLASPVLLDPKFEVIDRFGVQEIPSAVLVDEHGRVASNVAVGPQAALALLGEGGVTDDSPGA